MHKKPTAIWIWPHYFICTRESECQAKRAQLKELRRRRRAQAEVQAEVAEVAEGDLLEVVTPRKEESGEVETEKNPTGNGRH